jgi:tripartite-type tricarboxylate transporter receptor subunit TctC
MQRHAFTCSAAAVLLLAFASQAVADTSWPTRQVKLIVPYAAGSGASDAIARLVAERMSETWKQSVVVENVAGAAGSIGTARFVKSTADGYTIALTGDAPIAVNISLQKNIGYDPVKDLLPIIKIGTVPNVLVVNAAKGPPTLGDLVQKAKAAPGTLTFSSTGTGTSQHIALELLKRAASVDLRHVPGRGPTAPDLLGGHVDGSFMNIPIALPHVREGTLKALAQTGRTRSPMAPDVPTVAELGYPGFEAVPWFMVFAPAGTADAIVGKIHADLAAALRDPSFASRLHAIGVAIDSTSVPAKLPSFITSEIERMAEVIKLAGLKAE